MGRQTQVSNAGIANALSMEPSLQPCLWLLTLKIFTFISASQQCEYVVA